MSMNKWSLSPQTQETILKNRQLRHCRIYILFALGSDFTLAEKPNYLADLLLDKNVLLNDRSIIQFYPFRSSQLNEYNQPFVTLSAVVPEPWIISHTYSQVLRNNLLPSACIEQAHIWCERELLASVEENPCFEKWRRKRLSNIGRVDHFEHEGLAAALLGG